jgi:hypothetical protein
MMMFVCGLAFGVMVGFACGTWSEHRMWLDAICGREKIYRAITREKAQ